MDKQSNPGLAVDSSGNPAIDPTANVLQLNAASIKRIDDLFKAERRRVKDLRKADLQRMRSERRSMKEKLGIHFLYAEKLTKGEAERINAIRTFDVNAVTIAAQSVQTQNALLASQLAANAETLRSLVETSRAALATQLTQIITPMTERLAQLEKAQYEGVGKERVTDPITAQLLLEVKALRESNKESGGKSLGLAQALGWILFAIAAVGFAVKFVN
jgi:hypothetical protein